MLWFGVLGLQNQIHRWPVHAYNSTDLFSTVIPSLAAPFPTFPPLLNSVRLKSSSALNVRTEKQAKKYVFGMNCFLPIGLLFNPLIAKTFENIHPSTFFHLSSSLCQEEAKPASSTQKLGRHGFKRNTIGVRVRVITDHNFNFTVYQNKILSFYKCPLQFLKLGTLLRTLVCGCLLYWFLFNTKGKFIKNILILTIFLHSGHFGH